MIKRFFILSLFLFCTSCGSNGSDPLCQAFYKSESLSYKSKTFLCGSGGYKYKCKKAGDCCEIGKDCEEAKKIHQVIKKQR